jgi:hypothetical protein
MVWGNHLLWLTWCQGLSRVGLGRCSCSVVSLAVDEPPVYQLMPLREHSPCICQPFVMPDGSACMLVS